MVASGVSATFRETDSDSSVAKVTDRVIGSAIIEAGKETAGSTAAALIARSAEVASQVWIGNTNGRSDWCGGTDADISGEVVGAKSTADVAIEGVFGVTSSADVVDRKVFKIHAVGSLRDTASGGSEIRDEVAGGVYD